MDTSEALSFYTIFRRLVTIAKPVTSQIQAKEGIKPLQM